MRIIEFNASEQETSNKYFLWDGLSIAEEREGTPPTTVTRRYYAQGEIRDGVKYYYGRDHLGSVRDVVDESTGNVVARFDYDPYGRREQTVGAGTFAVDWGFTGHYFHEASGLHLAPFRAYAAELGRWLSRDPIGESGGLNIYEYVLSNPINFFDPLGLDIWDYIAPEWLINQHTADFSAGVGDTLSFGLTRYIRKWGQFDDVVNPCSWAYTAGEITGAVVATTAGGAGIVRNALSVGGKTGNLGQRLLRGGTRLFHDPRQFDTIRKQYWAYNGGARNLAGDVARHLHHWIIPQRAGFGFNASLNLLELPARLNSLMNGRGVGLWIERALRYGILGSLPTSAGLGMRWGLEKKAWRDEWGC
jgi:RHS repeat-associated protein